MKPALCWLLLAGACATGDVDGALDRILAARRGGPALRPGLVDTIPEAYALQQQVTRALLRSGDRIAGYKAAFTSPSAQQAWGASGPVFAPLMASMRVDDATAVSLGGYRALLGEVEIAFTLARSLPRGAGADPETLRSAVASVHVALDLADLRFDPDAGTPRVGDIIADGVGARRYVLGPPRDSLLLERRTECTLHVDETLVSRAAASDAWGDPWRVLEWMSTRTPLEAGQVVLTGALGSIYQGAKTPLSLVEACSGLGETRVLLR